MNSQYAATTEALSPGERRLLATMPLHAITALHGETGLRERLAIEAEAFPEADQDRTASALVLASHLYAADRRQREPYVNHLLRVAMYTAALAAGRRHEARVSSEEVPVPKDIRFDVPLFTVEEAAHHLGLPRTTLLAWARRQAGPAPLVHRIVDPDSPMAASLPFVAVVEAHMLRGFRELGLSAQGLLVSVARLRQDLGDEYALATRRVATDGVNLLADMSLSGDHAEWVRAVDGQLVIREVIDSYLQFVRWGKDDYPTRLRLKAYQGADVIIDPRFAFGQPVLERQKVRVEDMLDAFWAGESPKSIVTEFGVKADEVEAVIRSATRPRAA